MELVRPAITAISKAVEHSAVTENEFMLLYERTARPLRAYLYRLVNDISRADDLLQETYLRFLQARLPAEMSAEHRKNYLFRIATNLAHDEAAYPKSAPLADYPAPSNVAEEIREQNDCAHRLQQLTQRQRELLWLAYVEEFTHKEIADMLGIKAPSVRPMLARARQCLSEILRKGELNSK
jgi:RNA polymerase sigma-70 factor (ECF subfamily)